jgi:uncharacterized membrane protein
MVTTPVRQKNLSDNVTFGGRWANQIVSTTDTPDCRAPEVKRITIMNTTARKFTHAALAGAFALSAAAAIAAPAPSGSSGGAIGKDDMVHCYGVHSCKGNSDCATTENACSGQNACKGHGFKAMKAGECLTKGGVIGDLK